MLTVVPEQKFKVPGMVGNQKFKYSTEKWISLGFSVSVKKKASSLI